MIKTVFVLQAVSIPDSGLCSNVLLGMEYVGVSDGVQRQLLVEVGIPGMGVTNNTTLQFPIFERLSLLEFAPLLVGIYAMCIL